MLLPFGRDENIVFTPSRVSFNDNVVYIGSANTVLFSRCRAILSSPTNFIPFAKQYADNVDRNNSAKLEKYVTKIETQIEDLRKEVDNKKLSKITAKNSEISKKLESLKKEITK